MVTYGDGKTSHTYGANSQLKSHHFTQTFFFSIWLKSFTDFGNYGYILPVISFDKCITEFLSISEPGLGGRMMALLAGSHCEFAV